MSKETKIETKIKTTRPSVNYAKDWLDQLIIGHYSSFMVWSGLEKGITLDVIAKGLSTTIFMCIRPFSTW